MFVFMDITIAKKEIFDEVEKRTSLEGSVLPERFEGVWASKEEGAFLDSYWVEGYTAVIQLMKRYLKSRTVAHEINLYDKDEVLTILVDMPDRYNSLLDGSVATDIKMMIACNVLHGWLEVKLPEAAPKYEEESKGYAEDLRVKLLYRTEPKDRTNLTKKGCYDDKTIYPKCEYLNNAKKDCELIPSQWQSCSRKERVETKRKECCEREDKYPFGFDAYR